MENNKIWQEEIIVSPYDTDFWDEWKAASLVRAMQTIGNRHAVQLGFSMDALAGANQAWILARLKIRFFQTPRVDDTIKIRTFHKGIQQKIFFMRDAQFLNPAGKIVAAGSTAWVIVDRSSRKILPGTALNTSRLPLAELSALEEPLEKIPVPEGMARSGSCTATYNMTDIMGHVNNTRYVEWATDCFSIDHYRKHRLAALQINYANEVKPDEQVEFYTASQPEQPLTWVVVGENTSSGKRSFEACLNFTDRSQN